MGRTSARLLGLATFVAAPALLASLAGCNGDTTDLFGSGTGGAGGAGASTSSKSTTTIASTSVTTTTTVATTTGSSMPGCGNGLVDGTDQCDGFDLDGQTCASLGFEGGGLDCSASCTFDTSGCQGAATCNGTLEPGEECDGQNLNGASCTNFGFTNPAGLACNNCQLDPGNCKPTCGDNNLEDGEACDDGNKNAGDGCSPTCTIEMPTGNGATCATAIPVALAIGSQSTAGSTMGGGAHTPSTCQGGDGPDRVYAVTPQSSGFLTATLPRANANFDSMLWISTSCAAAQIQDVTCADSYDAATGQSLDGGEIVSLRVQAGTTYYVFVDTWAANASGNYQLQLNLSAGTCADPVPIALEPGSSMTFLGSNNNILPADQGSCGGAPGGEVTYRLTPTFTDGIGISTDTNQTNFNAALYARTTCASAQSELGCSNQAGNAQESINVNGMVGTSIFVKIDGSQSGGGNAFGNYALKMNP